MNNSNLEITELIKPVKVDIPSFFTFSSTNNLCFNDKLFILFLQNEGFRTVKTGNTLEIV